MNILITGVNATQAKQVNSRLGLINGIYAVIDSLKTAGHTVHQRPIVPGEDFSGYDRVIIYQAPPGGFSSAFIFGAMYAYARCKPSQIILALDDWQSHRIVKGYQGFLNGLDKNLAKPMYDRHAEWVPYRTAIASALRELGFDSWKAPLLAPTFGGLGDLSDLGIPAAGPQWAFDPSGFFENCYATVVTPKSERWIFSSLTDRTKWLDALDVDWEVYAFGHSGSGHDRVPEIELINQYYASAMGVLSPPTGHRTGLWWRSRYQFAIEAGALLAGDAKETSFCGSAYAYSPRELEHLCRQGKFRELVAAQRQQYFAMRWSKTRLQEAFSNWVN